MSGCAMAADLFEIRLSRDGGSRIFGWRGAVQHGAT